MKLMPATWIRLLVLAAAGICSEASAAERYGAWLADGTQIWSRSLSAWPIPGSSYRFKNHDLATTGNPVRLVRDRYAAPTLKPPYVVLANGDVLGGTLVALDSREGRVGEAARVQVEVDSPLMPVVGTAVAVRADRIVRIVGPGGMPTAEALPGSVVLSDGRRLIARAVRWRERGLALLTDEGV